jgi:hypothetical protein
MFTRRHAILLALATSLVLTLLSPIAGTGCGPGAPDVDKAALYTPESLAQEFALRFGTLNPDAKKVKPSARSKPMSAKAVAARDAADQAKKKVVGATTKKRTGPPTIDDLLADIDNKLNLIKGTSRSDACRRMIDTISQDGSVTASDKKTLTELVGRLSEGL